MKQKKVYLAVDLGAASGRVLAGVFNGQRIELHDVNRFDNAPVRLPTGWHWSITELYQNILEGLKLAAERYGDAVVSVGVDTWGVDYALFDKDGRILGLPYQYRDSRTDGIMEKVFEHVPKDQIYKATGIQFIFFNSLFQLYSEVILENPMLEQAEDLLFMPDMIGYWLTGNKTQERSIASTSQLYNPSEGNWDYSLIESLGLPCKLFKSISDPGSDLGALSAHVAEQTGLQGVKVVTVAGHDTGSAVAAVPSQAETPAYLSSGTWSLMGLDLEKPVINDHSYADNFTNEVGVNGRIRYLKNICGLWLIQECKRHWHTQGEDLPYNQMASLATEAQAFRSLIDPDDACFAKPGDMPEKIKAYCREKGQVVPETKGEIIRTIYESLALRYATVWEKLIAYTETPPCSLHVVGGGSQDKLLNQFTANALGTTVHAGPVEATSLGNIMAQMMADGLINTLAEGRAMVADSFPVESYEPTDTASWNGAKERFAAICATS